MLVIRGRNVNDIYAQARTAIRRVGTASSSRAGDVLVAPYPVMSVYEKPCERVLWCAARDANPFFHLAESIWMLAGRDDAEFLNRFVRDFGDRFAEEGGRLHGAYGARWRYHWELDQLRVVIERLRRDANDRRVVISMWDPDHDLCSRDQWAADAEAALPASQGDTYSEPRDLPCNTQLFPRIVNGALDLTVLCRSNDVIWGAYGANAVHFSFLLEYLAAAIGVPVGKMYQLSNNWHGYVDVLNKTGPQFAEVDRYVGASPQDIQVAPTPMVSRPEQFLQDCEKFCDDPLNDHTYSNPWFYDVATPMARTAAARRAGDAAEAVRLAALVAAPDWRLAAQRWLQRREK